MTALLGPVLVRVLGHRTGSVDVRGVEVATMMRLMSSR